MSFQEPLFFDSPEDAARYVVQVLGGAKTVAHQMRSTKSPDAAARWLLDCLNPDRSEHLQLVDFIWLAREGRKIGCHVLANYVAAETGYSNPVPVEPEDQRDALMREYVALGKRMIDTQKRMERIMQPDLIKMVKPG